MKYKPNENEFWNEKEAKNLFQTLPFYNVLIEKPKIIEHRIIACVSFL